MSEPLHTATACGIAYVSCHAIGAEPAALVLAMLGAVGATMFADALNDLKRTYGAILLSTLLGGYGTPAVLAVADIYAKRNNLEFPIQTLINLAPLVVGALVVVILPHLVGWLPKIPGILPAVLRWLAERGK